MLWFRKINFSLIITDRGQFFVLKIWSLDLVSVGAVITLFTLPLCFALISNQWTLLTSSVALQRLYRSKSDNHFYTTSEPQADNATARGYVRQKSPGKVAKSETDCNCEYNFIPIYRVHYADHNSLLENYFFTERREEANKFVSVYGYNNEGIEFYCSRIYGHCGATQQLVRFWRGNDHYYGSNNTEAEVIFEESFRNLTGVIKAERSLCYIWPWRKCTFFFIFVSFSVALQNLKLKIGYSKIQALDWFFFKIYDVATHHPLFTEFFFVCYENVVVNSLLIFSDLKRSGFFPF